MEKNQTELRKTMCPSNSYRNTAQSTPCDLIDCILKKKTFDIFPACCWHNSVQCQPSITKVSEQDRAQFTHKWKAAVSRGISMILLR